MRILRQGVLPPGSPYALSPATQAPAEASPADGEADTFSYELHAQATQVVPASWAADG